MDSFSHTLTQAEIRSGYLNLTPDSGVADLIRSLPHTTPLIVVDREKRCSRAQKHHRTQVWGTFRDWMNANGAHPGMQMLVMYSPHEWIDGCHVLHVYVVPSRHRSLTDSAEASRLAV